MSEYVSLPGPSGGVSTYVTLPNIPRLTQTPPFAALGTAITGFAETTPTSELRDSLSPEDDSKLGRYLHKLLDARLEGTSDGGDGLWSAQSKSMYRRKTEAAIVKTMELYDKCEPAITLDDWIDTNAFGWGRPGHWEDPNLMDHLTMSDAIIVNWPHGGEGIQELESHQGYIRPTPDQSPRLKDRALACGEKSVKTGSLLSYAEARGLPNARKRIEAYLALTLGADVYDGMTGKQKGACRKRALSRLVATHHTLGWTFEKMMETPYFGHGRPGDWGDEPWSRFAANVDELERVRRPLAAGENDETSFAGEYESTMLARNYPASCDTEEEEGLY